MPASRPRRPASQAVICACRSRLGATHQGNNHPIRHGAVVGIHNGGVDNRYNYATYLDGLNNLGCPIN